MQWVSPPYLHCLLALVLLLSGSVQALLNITIGNISMPMLTLDYFQSNYPVYALTNAYVLPMSFNASKADCTFISPSVEINNRAPSPISSLTHSFAVIPPGMANAAGCHTIAQTSEAVAQYNDRVIARGFPPISVLLYFSPFLVKGVVGGPLSEEYLSHKVGISDGVPSLRTVILYPTDYVALSNVSVASQGRSLATAVLTQDIGPWNAVFQSSSYVAYTWILFTINLALVIYATWRLLLLTLNGYFRFDLRTAVFLLGLVSAVFVVIMIPMRRQTYAYFLLQQISTFLFSCGFYFLLLLWSGVLSRVQVDRSFAPFRMMIYFCLFTSFYTMILGLVWLNIWPNSSIGTARSISRIWIPASQAGIAIIFLIYAVRFNMRRHDYNASKDTRRALTKLAKLSVAGFSSFIMVSAVNVALGQNAVISNVGSVAAGWVVIDISSLIRGGAILLVLDVKLPSASSVGTSSSQNNQGYSGSSSGGWGGWSRGWKKALFRNTSSTDYRSHNSKGENTRHPDYYAGADSSFAGQYTSYGGSQHGADSKDTTTSYSANHVGQASVGAGSAASHDDYPAQNPQRVYLRSEAPML
ncbi:hypothetical protein BJ684DRAFT_15124 [Piptocephalis cylindrospora]|uniref:Lung seven transmembrane receptor-domain-containing protein n=1 Tax=Piptocephalis cylindrospora TaxID=1907219 RepID=A0A4P9Y6G3_9FUNG|nr:hypothetical protein BJ684DRAFT_15124 [Piptocephalis cylindrospora]|eukprot:RKP14553.1 hypothetical protein BJ684DRAFT_15124 [Piptocephalis cylindrospora]